MSSEHSKGRELTPCQRQWLAHLKNWQAQHTLGLKAYAEHHGLSVSGLYTAKRHFKRKGIWQGREARPTSPARDAAKLVPVRVEAPVPVSAPAPAVAMYRVHLPNGLVLDIAEHAEATSTQHLVSALMGARS